MRRLNEKDWIWSGRTMGKREVEGESTNLMEGKVSNMEIVD
jgi:hypothetical protein